MSEFPRRRERDNLVNSNYGYEALKINEMRKLIDNSGGLIRSPRRSAIITRRTICHVTSFNERH